MPGTFKSKESFPKETTEEQVKEEQRLRVKAGAIKSEYSRNEDGNWTLITEWNVIGEQ